LQNSGLWYLNHFECPPWLGGDLGECNEHLQYHFTICHFPEALSNKRLIISTFPFCSFILCPLVSFILQSSFPFVKFVYRLFVCGHLSRWPPSMVFFPLVHFHVLRGFLNIFPSCLFPSLANDTHNIGLDHVVPLAFDHFVSQLVFLGLVVQLHNCSAWAPFGFHLLSWLLLPYWWH